MSHIKINFCKSCLTERLFIIKSFDNNRLLNKNSELVSTCRYKNDLLLKGLKRNSRRNDAVV